MADIAVAAAIAALRKTSNIIGDLVVKENSRLSSLQEEVSWIEREMRHIQSYLRDAQHRQGENERVTNLVKDIRDLAFDVEDTMEKYIPLLPNWKGFKGFVKRIPHILIDGYHAHNFIMKIEATKRRVEDINRVRQTYNIIERSDPDGVVENEGWDERHPALHVNEQNIVGFENHLRKLVVKVHSKGSDRHVISVIGMGGLGKTTLAKKVYKSVKDSFELKAFVYVTEKPIVRNILQDIARQVGLGMENCADNIIKAELFEHLHNNRYVIVFDDIWDTKAWDAIKEAIPIDSDNNNKIILTSRHKEVGIYVGGQNSLFELQPLRESFSKQLFEASMGLQQTENDPPQLKEIGEKILRRCGGVPLAIVVVAGLLKLKKRMASVWNGVLEQMYHGVDSLSKTFALSYNDLPANLKPCFLYFGMFPEDHKIDTFDLINLWAAEGFIDGKMVREDGSSVREVEDVGEDYLHQLVARNLIQVIERGSNGKISSCRIHDLLRSLCIQVGNEINFFISPIGLSNYDNMRVRRITTNGVGLGGHIFSNRKTPKLRSFLSFDGEICTNNKKPFHFLKDLHFLRVLYLRISTDGKICVFPKEISSLRNLTYLKLLQCDEGIVHIPDTIINLENLVALDLRVKKSSKLFFPMVVWNMKRLKHIVLSMYKPWKSSDVTLNYKGFDHSAIRFQNFQTLVLDGNILQADWLHKFSNLRTLEIIGPSKEITELLLNSNLVLSKLETLRLNTRFPCYYVVVKTLKLSGYHNLSVLDLEKVKIDQWPKPDELAPNLPTIFLKWCQLEEDLFELIKKIPKNRRLKLHSVYVNQAEKVWGSLSQRVDAFTGKSIASLSLDKGKIKHWPEPDELPPDLTEISLRSCKMEEDPIEVMKKIPKLKKLKLSYIKPAKKEYVFFTGEDEVDFFQLEQLTLKSPDVSMIKIEDGALPSLKKLVLYHRTRLEIDGQRQIEIIRKLI